MISRDKKCDDCLTKYYYLVHSHLVRRWPFSFLKSSNCILIQIEKWCLGPELNSMKYESEFISHQFEMYVTLTTNPDIYRTLKVSKTFQVVSSNDIANTVIQLADFIEKNVSMDDLSIRILLPREAGSGLRTQKWGLSLRTSLLLALKRKGIRPNLREVRYVHDDYHYGWILIDPRLFDNLCL